MGLKQKSKQFCLGNLTHSLLIWPITVFIRDIKYSYVKYSVSRERVFKFIHQRYIVYLTSWIKQIVGQACRREEKGVNDSRKHERSQVLRWARMATGMRGLVLWRKQKRRQCLNKTTIGILGEHLNREGGEGALVNSLSWWSLWLLLSLGEQVWWASSLLVMLKGKWNFLVNLEVLFIYLMNVATEHAKAIFIFIIGP